jgi:hypothetical protein
VLHTAAYWLMLFVRETIPATRDLARAEFATLRLRLLKIAVREDTDEAVHFVQSEAVQAFRFQAVHGSEVKSSTLAPLFGSLMDGG